MATSQKIRAENIVQSLMREISKAIALKALLEKFAHDSRIEESFNNTYEAHAFNLIENSLNEALTINLIRMCDESERDDVDSFRVLFEIIVPSNDAANYFGDCSSHFEEARKLYEELKGSHQLSRTIQRRHKFVAHNATKKDEVQILKYNYLYELLSKCKNILKLLILSVLQESTDYEGEEEVWQEYSKRFFNNLIEGQKSRKDTQ